MPIPEQSIAAGRSLVDPPSSAKRVPPLELQHRVTDAVEPAAYLHYGRQSALDVEGALASADRTLDTFDRILDFGCGPGRVLMWLEHLAARSELHGTDIDQRSIQWVREQLPYVTAGCNPPVPPLEYPDEYFDLVYSHSVFTHIDEAYQDLWLAELQRVTKPGGILLASVHGQPAFDRAVADVVRMNEDPSGWAATLAQNGILHIANDTYVGGPFPDFYHTTFHLPWYVFAHWGQFFVVRSYLARRSLDHQDFVLLQRPVDGSAPPPPLVQPAVAAASPVPAAEPGWDQGGPALARLAAIVNRGLDVNAPTRYGAVSRSMRRLVSRAVRHHWRHQEQINRAVVDAGDEEAARRAAADRAILDELSRRDARPNSLDPLAAEILKRQGERINRLECDVREALAPQPGDRAGETRGDGNR